MSFLNIEEIKVYRSSLDEVKANLKEVEAIAASDKQKLLAFINSQKQNGEIGEHKDENGTIVEDIQHLKNVMSKVQEQLGKMMQIE